MTALRIFVSYEATDTAFATQLMTDLQDAGAEILTDKTGEISNSIDDRPLPTDPHDRAYEQFLSKELSHCQYLIVVQTPEALQAPRMQLMVETALQQVQAGQMTGVLRVLAPTLHAVKAEEVHPMWAMTPLFDASLDYSRALVRLYLHLGIDTADVYNVPPPISYVPPLVLPDPQETGSKSPVSASLATEKMGDIDRPIRPYRRLRVPLRSLLIPLSIVILITIIFVSITAFSRQSSTPIQSPPATQRVIIHPHTPTTRPTTPGSPTQAPAVPPVSPGQTPTAPPVPPGQTPVPPPPPPPPKICPPTIQNGSQGSWVKTLQERLNALGFRDPQGQVLLTDGVFGTRTEYAVKNFQTQHAPPVDGVVGPITWSALGYC